MTESHSPLGQALGRVRDEDRSARDEAIEAAIAQDERLAEALSRDGETPTAG